MQHQQPWRLTRPLMSALCGALLLTTLACGDDAPPRSRPPRMPPPMTTPNNTSPPDTTPPNTTTPPDTTPPDPGPVETPEQVVTELQQIYVNFICSAAWECPERNAELLGLATRYTSQQDCFMKLGEQLGNNIELPASVNADRIAFDVEKSKACFDALRPILTQAKCTGAGLRALESGPPVCDEVFTGLVTRGGGCALSEDCAGDLFCRRGGATCHGVCESLAACGEVDCAQGEVCVNTPEGPQCQTGRSDGEACDFGENRCQADLLCNFEGQFDAEGVCVQRGSLGAGVGCQQSDVCSASLVCRDFVCASPPTLQPGATGEPCTLQPGMPCGPGLSCQEVSAETGQGSCAPLAALGDPCIVTTQCAIGHFCEGAQGGPGGTVGACAAVKPAGKACVANDNCASTSCDNGLCAGPRQVCVVP